MQRGHLQEAEASLREAASIQQEALPEQHARTESLLGMCLARQERYAEAAPLLRESYAILAAGLGEARTETQDAARRLAVLPHTWREEGQQ